MPQIWLTSDTHFNDNRVSQLRNFSSIKAHDDWIVRAWNRQVQDGDIVYHLGDVALGHLSKWIHRVHELNGEIRLIAGNHDRIDSDFKNVSREIFNWYLGNFDTIQQHAIVKGKKGIYPMSHYPYTGEGERDMEERYTQWRLRDEGVPLIHGHTHSKERLSYSDKNTPMLHVGWDAWYRPVRIYEAEQMIQNALTQHG